jgi:predicted LPLAT superfamily acyltransferase
MNLYRDQQRERSTISALHLMIWAALGVPVLLGFGLYRGGRHYSAHFELFAERVSASRQRRAADLQAWAQRYAQRLEHYARQAPYNWFNFYDYWFDELPSHHANALRDDELPSNASLRRSQDNRDT